MGKDSLGDRMKLYEGVSDVRLAPRIPIIIRVDGRAFHRLTKGMEQPWDPKFVQCMTAMAAALCSEIDGCKFAFAQSDEVSLLLTDWDRYQTQGWFKYRLQKITSLAAAIATDAFGKAFRDLFDGTKFIERPCRFDARVASYPQHEVVNYFVWRQQDTTRNSIQMLARAHFSHKQCHGKNTSQLQDMLHASFDINWNDTPTHLKRGTALYKGWAPSTTRDVWLVDVEPPIFTRDREFIGKHLTDVFWKEDDGS